MSDPLAQRPPHVLVVEGDGATRAALRVVLEAEGFSILEAQDGVTGVQKALQGGVDLVLVDVTLPDIAGEDVAARLKGQGLLAPIVALLDRGAKERGVSLSAGCAGAVEKPVDPSTIGAQLRAFLAGKKERLNAADEKKYLREHTQALVEKLESNVRELTRTNDRLTSIDRFKTDFMQSVSHELSTPLTPILGYLQILKSRKLGALTEKQERVIDAMTQSGDRLSRLLDNLADFAGLEVGHAPLRRGPVDLAVVAHAAVAEALGKARPRRVAVSVRDATGGRTIDGDEARLKQALGNLVDNAVKFAPNGSTVLVEAGVKDGRAWLAVFDQGPGIPPEQRDRLFEPYFHAGRTADAPHAPGAGLGLPVVQRIALAHGGKAVLESPPREQPIDAERRFDGLRAVIELPAGP